MAKKKSKSTKQVESIRHKDKRVNIPTEELRDFVAEDESKPKTMLYPRDPSLDPQLVWKGKDEQDREDLAVPVVPVYIQEKIHPQAIIENVKAQARKDKPASQTDFYSNFNGIDTFEKRVDFYHHGFNWSNRMILGDSLLVMTSLAEKEGLKGKVQTIYLDPPYGIKFSSNWQVSTRKRDVKDGRVEDTTRQPEQIRAFRDTWKLGIHSYLAYLRDRLVAARELLTETGSIFVQIGDENVHLVRNLLDEVFGSENFVSQITFTKTRSLVSSDFVTTTADFLLWYAKARGVAKMRKPLVAGESVDLISHYEADDGSILTRKEGERLIEKDRGRGLRPFMSDNLIRSANPELSVVFNSKHYRGRYRTNTEGMKKLAISGRLLATKNQLRYKFFLSDFPVSTLSNVWSDVIGPTGIIYVVQTNNKVIERCVMMTTDPGDLVLDPTCGSGTTAYVAEQWGRRWITIDTSRVALALARTRLMAAKFPYYSLADSPEGLKKEAELTGRTPPTYKTENDIRKGFVYKRVPHVTLKSIANNPDIKEGMTREEIDKAVARHAETELLYDQPYEDKKRIRVSGPLTVESLSPYRVLSTDEERPVTEREGQRDSVNGQFETMVIENLKKAGVQNTMKKDRLKFDTISPYAGTWIHAAGDYTDSDGKVKRAAISIGPKRGLQHYLKH